MQNKYDDNLTIEDNAIIKDILRLYVTNESNRIYDFSRTDIFEHVIDCLNKRTGRNLLPSKFEGNFKNIFYMLTTWGNSDTQVLQRSRTVRMGGNTRIKMYKINYYNKELTPILAELYRDLVLESGEVAQSMSDHIITTFNNVRDSILKVFEDTNLMYELASYKNEHKTDSDYSAEHQQRNKGY